MHITLNKNTIVGDKSAVTPGGIRIGTPSVTTRGYLQNDMREVARFIDEAFQISLRIQDKSGNKLKDFKLELGNDGAIDRLASEVNDFSC